MKIGSLFSGIGGLELGLEWAGLGPVVWQCEVDPFCRAVLEKHWPNATRFIDVTQPRDYPHADLICGGFPCQDVSSQGRGRGLQGERSSLWFHFAKVVAQVRPSWVVVENVASGVHHWLSAVRRHLCELGYGARAFDLSAAAVGAAHRRRRIFVVAHAHGRVRSRWLEDVRRQERPSRSESEAGARDATVPRDPSVRRPSTWAVDRWDAQPDVVRMVHGLPAGMDGRRRRALGNAVVPQCAEAIGRMILRSTQATDTKDE